MLHLKLQVAMISISHRNFMERNMKNYPGLRRFLKHNRQKLTPGRTYLIQYFIDHKSKMLSVSEIQSFMRGKLPEINRSSIYRNLKRLSHLKIIREVTLSNRKKRYQFSFDQPLSRFLFCCKSCGAILRGSPTTYRQIERAIKEIQVFRTADLSVTFYGFCSNCPPRAPYFSVYISLVDSTTSPRTQVPT